MNKKLESLFKQIGIKENEKDKIIQPNLNMKK